MHSSAAAHDAAASSALVSRIVSSSSGRGPSQTARGGMFNFKQVFNRLERRRGFGVLSK